MNLSMWGYMMGSPTSDSAQCFIALRFNSGDNLSHTFLYGRVVGDIALRQSVPGVA